MGLFNYPPCSTVLDWSFFAIKALGLKAYMLFIFICSSETRADQSYYPFHSYRFISLVLNIKHMWTSLVPQIISIDYFSLYLMFHFSFSCHWRNAQLIMKLNQRRHILQGPDATYRFQGRAWTIEHEWVNCLQVCRLLYLPCNVQLHRHLKYTSYCTIYHVI
jgi:hypothetical protein